MNKYGLHGKLKATPGNGQKLAEILLEASRLVSTAKGFGMYMVSLDAADQDAVVITEVWDSKEDHDNSLKSDKVKALIGQAMPILAEMPTGGMVLEVLNFE
ncbi:MAG: antibiotic biosynthesis monooxygenase [Saprospiraceae bacterium]|nr:antibiotic biosynthesis monooxygenase [Saprospiraceae bacterium]MCB9325102.1 antibiotic biosynthesis monooxygenase [Lewinellaceae bacterium]